MNDSFGEAISDYFKSGVDSNLIVNSNYTEDEIIPVSYFFRTEKEMSKIEKTALKLCSGNVLDVGAAAGCHSIILQNKNINVTALEGSKRSTGVLKKRGIQNIINTSIYSLSEKKYDTILLLINGTGIGETLEGLQNLLVHLKTLLQAKGKILIDSSDIKYLFEEEDGSTWIDLTNTKYYGEMEYEVSYKNTVTKFKWLFVDFDRLKDVARKADLKCKLVEKGEHYDYLAQMTI